jgi:hypothetical protein
MFKSKNNRNIRRLRMEDFDYEYDTQILVLSVENSRNNGCLRDQFVVWSKKDYLEHKIRILELYRERVPGFPDIPNEIVQREVDYIFECRY